MGGDNNVDKSGLMGLGGCLGWHSNVVYFFFNCLVLVGWAAERSGYQRR